MAHRRNGNLQNSTFSHKCTGQIMMLALIVILLTAAVATYGNLNLNSTIHIGLVGDERSIADLMIAMQSAVDASVYPSSLYFHVVICGSEIVSTRQLAAMVKAHLENCLTIAHLEVVDFVLPSDSGFYKQLTKKGGKHHWTSSSGADMVRFYLPSLFPQLARLLYIDNDVIIGCCLEEVWNSLIDSNKAIGIVLDELQWAIITQFHRHYNASHPILVASMRRSRSPTNISTSATDHITLDEFEELLPKYPNDGVILFDISNYNKFKILDIVNNIAEVNSQPNQYVVNAGTQQFTVLALHDSWSQLTHRANMRHSPDVSRNAMAHNLFHGFIHFAGIAKPLAMCKYGPRNNEHRVQSYTPWAISVNQLMKQCPNEPVFAQYKDCSAQVQSALSLREFFALVQTVVGRDDASHNNYFKILASLNTTELLRVSLQMMPVESSEDMGTVEYLDNFMIHRTNFSGHVVVPVTALAAPLSSFHRGKGGAGDARTQEVSSCDVLHEGGSVRDMKLLRKIYRHTAHQAINISDSMLAAGLFLRQYEHNTNNSSNSNNSGESLAGRGVHSEDKEVQNEAVAELLRRQQLRRVKWFSHHVNMCADRPVSMSARADSGDAGGCERLTRNTCLPFASLLDMIAINKWSVKIVSLDSQLPVESLSAAASSGGAGAPCTAVCDSETVALHMLRLQAINLHVIRPKLFLVRYEVLIEQPGQQQEEAALNDWLNSTLHDAVTHITARPTKLFDVYPANCCTRSHQPASTVSAADSPNAAPPQHQHMPMPVTLTVPVTVTVREAAALVAYSQRWLLRHGFLPNFSLCSHHSNSNGNNNDLRHRRHARRAHLCVWGVRMNIYETK